MDFHAISPEKTLSELKTSKNGLSDAEAELRLKQYGLNELKQEKTYAVLSLFLSQFKNFLIILLLIATAISIFLGEWIDAAAMFAIVLLSALLGLYQEYKAEKAIEALKSISAPTATAIRSGREVKISAAELVPGDVVMLEAGNIVPADSRIIDASNMQIDEASLTGESVPSGKFVEALKPSTIIADQENMAFMGTIVTYGKGKIVVTGTGMQTELGKIATSLQETKQSKTPLQIKFELMAKQIGLAVLALVLVVFVAAIATGESSLGELFIFALSLAVAAIPSSLPAIVTIGLSMGTKTLAAKNMIIKKLPAAESLGAVTIICSDKTGTITKNQMTVVKLYHCGKVINVTGTGYKPSGEFLFENKHINTDKLELLFRIGMICNNAKLSQANNKFEIMGDPTEGALVVLAKKAGISDNMLDSKLSLISELPFDSERKMMSVIYRNKSSRSVEAYTKGAPEILLTKCDRIYDNGKVRKLTKTDRRKIANINRLFAGQALRVLALAFKQMPESKKYSIESIEKNLIFVGLTGMIDPPREEVRTAVKQCNDAGIKVMIITGDHALTTKAVAQQIRIFRKGDLILTGSDLEKLSDAKLSKVIGQVRIIARALPIQKLRVVDMLQKKGHIVAMTGDGVNDAPALKKANIGVAMGITGTDVAKQVAEATLADDNFATIVNAVSEGRNIYDKIIKSTRYLLACNAGEIVTVFLAILMKLPLPLVPLQILMMNLLTDGLPALGLGAEPSDKDIMNRRPRKPKENPISVQLIFLMVIFGMVMGAGTLYLFNSYIQYGVDYGRTVAFTTLVMFQMFAAIGSRSMLPFKKINLLTNKWLFAGIVISILIHLAIVYVAPLQHIFETVSLTSTDWIKIIAVSSMGYLVMEFSKFLINWKGVKQYKRPTFFQKQA